MKIDDQFIVWNNSLAGQRVREGVARLHRPHLVERPERQYWEVEFADYPGVYFFRWINAADRVDHA